jgi:hypothetical protein
MITSDIDIDVADRGMILDGLHHVQAVEQHQGMRRRHVGAYFQDIPIDPLDGMAVWEHNEAKRRGYAKIDFIHNTIYDHVRDEAHLVDLLTTEPRWELFDDERTVRKLAHIGNHFHVVQQIHPRSIEEVAICLALPRPGKQYLIGQPRDVIEREIWLPTVKYSFKKAHAISFASATIVQLNLLCQTGEIG